MLALLLAALVCSQPCKKSDLRDPVSTVVLRSSHVFVGTASSVQNPETAVVRFKVTKWLKGKPGPTIDIINPCSYCVPIEIGQQYLIYAYPTPDGPMINPHTRSRLLSEVPAVELAKLEPDRVVRLTADEEAIIRTVLGSPGEKVVITAKTVPIFSPAGEAPKGVPAALVDKLTLRSESETADLTLFDLPGAVRVESPEKIDAAFNDGFWDEFYKRFNATTLVSVSLPVIDGNTAIIYRGMTCGGLCGDGSILKLERDGKGWKVVARYSLWVS